MCACMCVCICACMHTCMCTCLYTSGGQRTTFRSQFSLFALWVLGTELRLSGLAAGVFSHSVILPVPVFNFCLSKCTLVVTLCGENVLLGNYFHLMRMHPQQIIGFPADRLKVKAVSHPVIDNKHGSSGRFRHHEHVDFFTPSVV